MTVSEVLENTWRAVLAEALQSDGLYHRRIPIAFAWPAHTGIRRPEGIRLLMLETDRMALRGLSFPDETKGFRVDIGNDEAGRADRAIIRIQEGRPEYHEIFSIFCADVLAHWGSHSIAADGNRALVRRLDGWKRFFQRGTQAGLSREDYIGLYGELSFIDAALGEGLEPVQLLAAWQAPFGTNQDFLFGPVAVEIKTTTGNDIDTVRISNIRQLDSTALDSLFLTRYAFDFRNNSGTTLPQLVAAIRNKLLASSTEALSLFNDLLLTSRFVDGVSNAFDNWGFTRRQSDVYKVDGGFPRLLESSLPPGISSVSYILNLSAAESFRTIEAELWRTILSSHV